MGTKTLVVRTTLAVLVLGLLAVGCPRWNVYRQELRGKAALREAEYTRQIAVFEARAEVERARGVAEANRIIGDSLKDNEGYLRYLWLQGLQDGSSEVIYIPTEANLPILEAGKRKTGQRKSWNPDGKDMSSR